MGSEEQTMESSSEAARGDWLNEAAISEASDELKVFFNDPCPSSPSMMHQASAPSSPTSDGDIANLVLQRTFSSGLLAYFPMYVMHMKDFLALDRLRPHDELVVDGLVKKLDDLAKSTKIHFISHQWTGWKEADPNSSHLHTMQDVFRKAAAGGDSIFKTDDDWQSYAQGFSKTNAAFIETCHRKRSCSILSPKGLRRRGSVSDYVV